MMTTYAGFDLLDLTNPNREGSGRVTFNRLASMADNRTGKRTVDDRAGVAIPRHTFAWFARGKSEIAVLKSFIAARKGRAIPFWVPTYCRDLVLSRAITAGDGTIYVSNNGYTRYQYPYTSRQRIAIFSADGSFIVRKITTAIEISTTEESLILDSNIPGNMSGDTLISFLPLCRLTDDDIAITWHNQELAEALFSFTEIPKETP